MEKIIAIPTENGNLCPHFGHCESFYFASINDEKEITAEKNIVPPTHEPGLFLNGSEARGVNASLPEAWVKRQRISLTRKISKLL